MIKNLLKTALVAITITTAVVISCSKDQNTTTQEASSIVGSKFRAKAYTSTTGAGNVYYVLEFTSATSVSDNLRLIDNSNVTDKNMSTWSMAGTKITVTMDGASYTGVHTPGTITLDAKGGTRVYEKY